MTRFRCVLVIAMGPMLALPAFAAPIAMFDLGPPLFLGLAALLLIGGAVFARLGGRKGLVAFAVLLAAGAGYAMYENQSRRQALAQFQADQQRACAEQAGETGGALPAAPAQVIVRIDEPLGPGDRQGLRPLLIPVGGQRGVEIVRQWPASVPAGAALVDVVLLKESVAGAPERPRQGLRATLMNERREVVAMRTDYLRDDGRWCLGAEAPAAMERFLRQRTGRAIGLAELPDGATPADTPPR